MKLVKLKYIIIFIILIFILLQNLLQNDLILIECMNDKKLSLESSNIIQSNISQSTTISVFDISQQEQILIDSIQNFNEFINELPSNFEDLTYFNNNMFETLTSVYSSITLINLSFLNNPDIINQYSVMINDFMSLTERVSNILNSINNNTNIIFENNNHRNFIGEINILLNIFLHRESQSINNNFEINNPNASSEQNRMSGMNFLNLLRTTISNNTEQPDQQNIDLQKIAQILYNIQNMHKNHMDDISRNNENLGNEMRETLAGFYQNLIKAVEHSKDTSIHSNADLQELIKSLNIIIDNQKIEIKNNRIYKYLLIGLVSSASIFLIYSKYRKKDTDSQNSSESSTNLSESPNQQESVENLQNNDMNELNQLRNARNSGRKEGLLIPSILGMIWWLYKYL